MSQTLANMSLDDKVVNTIKYLAVDGVEKAKSGHPGLPMGAADYASVLWTKFLRYNPADPRWPNRDRFILSGGHGSMLLYTLLHLAGYKITLDDLKQFRQWDSVTPGHPEHDLDHGIETTTGPLGQGLSNAVGMAMAYERMAATFNKPGYELFKHYIYAVCGDGDMMEGISHESCALAGHLGLGNIILLYDDNQISIEGCTSLAYTDDVQKRFEAYHWQVQTIDGHDREAATKAIQAAKAETGKPSLIICKTTIGKGAPTKAGKASAHGEPLGADEVKGAKELIGWPVDQPFYVADGVYDVFKAHAAAVKPEYDAWQANFAKYCAEFPDMKDLWDKMMSKFVPESLADDLLDQFDCSKAVATRVSSGNVIQEVAKLVPAMWGGSADLSPSNKSDVKGGGSFCKENRLGKNLHFGVREHGMGACLNGMSVYGGVIPYGATFMVFVDYMRPTVRLAALMKQQVIFVMTHDSIFVGEDGPTHEPIEHLASMRCMPGLTVIRPADTAETVVAWAAALENKNGPTVLALSRQNLCSVNEDSKKAKQLRKGAYIVQDSDKIDVILISSGSEMEITMSGAAMLKEQGIGVRVVSMPSFELFEAQDKAYRDSVLPPSVTKRVAVEAASPFGWCKWVGNEGLVIGMNRFGASGPYQVLAEKFGFTAQNVAEKTAEYLKG